MRETWYSKNRKTLKGLLGGWWGRGEVLLFVGHTERICPKEVPFSGWRYTKG